MNIKIRLTILSFLQFFIWGSWLISIVGYLFSLKENQLGTNDQFILRFYGQEHKPQLKNFLNINKPWINEICCKFD